MRSVAPLGVAAGASPPWWSRAADDAGLTISPRRPSRPPSRRWSRWSIDQDRAGSSRRVWTRTQVPHPHREVPGGVTRSATSSIRGSSTTSRTAAIATAAVDRRPQGRPLRGRRRRSRRGSDHVRCTVVAGLRHGGWSWPAASSGCGHGSAHRGGVDRPAFARCGERVDRADLAGSVPARPQQSRPPTIRRPRRHRSRTTAAQATSARGSHRARRQ